MKRALLIGTFVALTAGGLVAAQTTQAPKSSGGSPAAGSTSPVPPWMSPGMMGGGPGMMGGPGGWGPGMIGGGMMGGGMCPMLMGGANTKVDVKKVDKGVSMTMTSSDPATAARLQKMAEAMRLMHEAWSQ